MNEKIIENHIFILTSLATFNPRMTDYIVMIFHKGELLNDITYPSALC